MFNNRSKRLTFDDLEPRLEIKVMMCPVISRDCLYTIVLHVRLQRRIQDFLAGKTLTYYSTKIPWKLHENAENWDLNFTV